MKTKIYWKVCGGHVHTCWFSRPPGVGSYAKNGDLVFREDEWPTIRDLLSSPGMKEVVQLIESAAYV